MNAIIISVGTELTTGQTIDTNSAYLARELSGHGISTTQHITVDDDQADIAAAIGAAAGLVCYVAVNLKVRLRYDDSLDAFGVHGVGGILGTIAVGIFATTVINPAGANGLFFGNPALVVKQILAAGATAVYAFVGTFILLKVLDATMGLRVTDEDEEAGLDLTQHGEAGYTM